MFVAKEMEGEQIGIILKALPMIPMADPSGVPGMGFNVVEGLVRTVTEEVVELQRSEHVWRFRQEDLLAWLPLKPSVTASRLSLV